MILDYLPNVNAYGDHLVRLYNFDSVQAAAFRDLFKELVIDQKKVWDLSEILFIDRVNDVNLKFRIFPDVELICELEIDRRGRDENQVLCVYRFGQCDHRFSGCNVGVMEGLPRSPWR